MSFGEFHIDGKQFALAGLLASTEFDQWKHKSDASKTSRLVGVLGEMFGAMYLETIAGSRSVIAQGLLHRMGIFAKNTLDRGDIVVLGKRTIKQGPNYAPYKVDSVVQYEIKASSTPTYRGMIECKAAQEYASRYCVGVVLLSIHVGDNEAYGVVEDQADPRDIVAYWPVVEVDGVPYYESPLVRRKINFDLAN